MALQRADFYLINGQTLSEAIELLTKVSEKAFSAGHAITILSESDHESEQISEYLWHARRENFLPNTVTQGKKEALNSSESDSIKIIQSDLLADSGKEDDFLITMNPQLAAELNNFNRVALIVKGNENQVQIARNSYKTLKNDHITVNIHDLRSTDTELGFYDNDGEFVVEDGLYRVFIGGSSATDYSAEFTR